MKMREDIQCLRGIAISLVFLYHLYPTVFLNGFLGVDIFFVISGFLMGKTLTHKKIYSYQDFMKFYYRRFKRILPLYFLILIIALIAVQLCLGDFWWYTNYHYGLSALLLSTNMQLIKDSQDYFNEFQADSSSLNAFIHTWSLGVEMQFYFIVPFIFLFLQQCKNDTTKLVASFYITILGCSAFLTHSDESFAFNFMPLRLWQFAAGFIALFWIRQREGKERLRNGYEKINFDREESQIFILNGEKENENEKEKENDNDTELADPSLLSQILIFLALAIVCIPLLPFKIEILILRPIVTLGTAFLIASGPENVLLKSSLLFYIGDISYAMYLVHWPIITIFNSYFVQYHVICLVTTIIISVILHEGFEKTYLNLEWKPMTTLILIFIAGNVILQFNVYNSFWTHNYPPSVQKVINDHRNSRNFLWLIDPDTEPCVEKVFTNDTNKNNLEIVGDCRYPGNGTLSIMVIGNSYAMNFVKYLRPHFHQNYSDWRLLSILDSLGFYSHNELTKEVLAVTKKHVEFYKPDVLVIMSRYDKTFRTPIQPNDKLLREMNESMAFYQKIVKKIYILDAHPLYQLNFLDNFVNHFIRGRSDTETLHLDKRIADDVMKFAAERLRKVDCEKCHLFSLSDVFVEGDKYLTFDRKINLTYVDNTLHLTANGVKLCDPAFESLAQEVMNTV